MKLEYDIIVVGAGHAGCEAALSAARMGSRVLLITMDMTKIAQMSCNPAMGGIAKGQIVREIDALGGGSGIVTDKSMIQFRMLNRSKGPAVWSPRAQCDRMIFGLEWRKLIESTENIDLWQDSVSELLISGSVVKGVKTRMNVDFLSKCVVLTIGTFENGIIYVGNVRLGGGRISEASSHGITAQLNNYGISSGRLKTGTPARIDGRSIDFEVLEEQKGDSDLRGFSFIPQELPSKQLSCYITYTNPRVHEILKTGFNDSPLYNGTIQGVGPRYCPSIESKIVTFEKKESHQLFLEPEGWETNEFYLNGFSSSLPLDIQYEAIRNVKGLENARLYRPGYAIEYDFFQPTQLKFSLETKALDGLFFAGQINGTTGYEEAAAQGIIAGINAVKKLRNEEPLVLKRDEAYIGVLIDDLVTKGVDEPYRMFTSRAEYRVLLRQDNADERLTDKAIELGLASNERIEVFNKRKQKKVKIKDFLRSETLIPESINPFLIARGTREINQKVKAVDLLLRPEIDIFDLLKQIEYPFTIEEAFERTILESTEIELKYDGYIQRERLLADKIKRLDHIKIDKNIDIDSLLSISTEGRFKLKKYEPETIGQAARISGISPSDINVLLLYMGR
ncbi:MAG TPA: tRNA uridine-5-carboxymethylaminomethyl(34) synthesis enzyme MnmG [Bacteroidales bacterium]|nr:tRNA uridine-5-carboxymethylaminomethyl(34) synthesis enzyme MnmG [Bacteroidales bacterium]